jgi:hypothetical protein
MTNATRDHFGTILLALIGFCIFVIAYVGAPGLWLWLTGEWPWSR